MDTLVYENEAVNTEFDSGAYHSASWLTLRELKEDPVFRSGLAPREWCGYLNLTDIIEGLERLKAERRIEYDDEIRIVF